MSKVRNRKITETDTEYSFVIINKNNEFLNHIYECEGAVFTKQIKEAELFHIYPNNEVLIPKWYKTVNGKKVKNIFELAESIDCKAIKVKAEIQRITQYRFIEKDYRNEIVE